MPSRENVDVPLNGLTSTNAEEGTTCDLGNLAGVHVMVLMRHRH